MSRGLNSTADFRAIVASETEQLVSLCSKWRKEIEADASRKKQILPEDVVGDINVAIGQAELLKKERFKQFRGLIDDCEFKRGEKETTIQDLQGFWDIIYFQVDDILKKFSALEKLQSNNWQKETQSTVIKPALPKSNARPRPAATRGRAASSSALRAHILAARSKMNKLSISNSSSPTAARDKCESAVPMLVVKSSTPERKSYEKENIPAITNNKQLVNLSNANGTKLNATDKSEDLSKSPKSVLQVASSNGNVKSFLRTPPKKSESDVGKLDQTSELQSEESSPPVTTFDAGFFKVQTPSKAKLEKQGQNNTVHVTPKRHLSGPGPDAKVLSSSLLKQRVRHTPVTHKDYSPCMRITRSMKKMRPAASAD